MIENFHFSGLSAAVDDGHLTNFCMHMLLLPVHRQLLETKTRSANELLEQCGRAQYHPHQLPIDRVRHRESLSSWHQPWAIRSPI